MNKAIPVHTLHKTNKILEVMKQDSRINPLYIHYAEWVKWDMEHILESNK